ncbi:MAG: undecaprenyldiphospho-muramoylpentapeptide beta-N-acetylglucosaminyltransferase [Flavobacteriales bacterium CG_4_10_14_0_2_um_filter_32_8]|nr:MAG: undecaprenyldiphospho-muramoylpentapeptide beta-N-acetylglucosaminyltransferase [Flavobacteriales bacterium CG_4_10_14_0_2_um_filter_32_8]
MQQYKIIISGGGTGGHIFPAIAIANAIKLKYPTAKILFVGALGKMEMEKVPAAGYDIIGLPIMGIQRRLTFQNFKVPFKVIASLLKAKKIVNDFKPDVVVGVGGYASGPLLKVATNKGIPALLQEQNSFPGITNKMLAKKVQRICVAYANMERFFPKEKIMLTGNPVRQDIKNLEAKRARGIEHFDLDATKKTVLVVGGSLGARTINQSIDAGLEEIVKNDIQLVWQTGNLYVNEANAAVARVANKGVKTMPFISKMDYAYAVADVVVSRAGAMSVSELSIAAKPTIFVPLPSAAEDHQTKNAMALVNYNAAIIVKDVEAKEQLIPVLINLIKDEQEQKKIATNVAKMAYTDAASIIADEVIKLIITSPLEGGLRGV